MNTILSINSYLPLDTDFTENTEISRVSTSTTHTTHITHLATSPNFIDPHKLRTGLIAPATETTMVELAIDHTSEPIKSLDDIAKISDYFLKAGRYRDNMLFILGINFGLRVSDLVSLRFSHLITDDCTFKDKFAILEKKTKNTRKVKKNRYITINLAVIEAVTKYLENTPNVSLSDYLFKSKSNNGYTLNRPIHRNSVDNILKKAASDLGIQAKISTHTLRKTFAYHQLAMSNNDPRKLLLLQKMFGHSSVAQTLNYIGITEEEIHQAYLDLNLGSEKYNYLINNNNIYEEVINLA